MRLYAQSPARRGRQLIADLIALLLIASTVKFALVVRDAILTLAEPGGKPRARATVLPPVSTMRATRPRRSRSSVTR